MSDPFSEMTDSMNEVMSLGGDVTKLRAYYKDWAKTCLLYTSPSPRDRG